MQEFKMIKMHFSTDRHKVHLFEDPITFFEFIAKGNTSYMLLGIGLDGTNLINTSLRAQQGQSLIINVTS